MHEYECIDTVQYVPECVCLCFCLWMDREADNSNTNPQRIWHDEVYFTHMAQMETHNSYSQAAHCVFRITSAYHLKPRFYSFFNHLHISIFWLSYFASVFHFLSVYSAITFPFLDVDDVVVPLLFCTYYTSTIHSMVYLCGTVTPPLLARSAWRCS